MRTNPDGNNHKSTGKVAGPHNERRLPPKLHCRRKNGWEEDRRKTASDATRLDDAGELQKWNEIAGGRDVWRKWTLDPA